VKTAIVIPALNEVATIRALAQRASTVADIVVVVDDGSTDGTSATLVGLPITLVRHERNLGKAASLWDGIETALAAGAETLVTMDGDGQHSVDDVPRLLRALAAHPGSLAIGARVRCHGPMPRSRRFANRFADFWVSWAAGHRVLDSQSGQRAYPAALLRGIALPHGPSRGFTFESELLIEAARHGYRTVSVPIDAVYGTAPRASHFRPWRDTARIAAMIAGRLVRGGLHLPGLVGSLRHGAVIHDPTVDVVVGDEDYDERASHAHGAE
jgi:glycosyltransferase involved in cell wall biosynthesis